MVVVLLSCSASSSYLEADVVPTVKTGLARKQKSRETRGFPRTRPPTQGLPTRWLVVVVVVVVEEEEVEEEEEEE